MSITQTYYLAHKARAKLSHEAARPDHDLRLLVGHANLLDGLMLELAQAEREQESWFNQSVRGASSPRKVEEQQQRVQWADRVVEEPEEDWDVEHAEDADSDSSSDSEDSDSEFDDDEDVEMADAVVSLRRLQSQHDVHVMSTVKEFAEDVEEDDDEEDFAQLTLTRSPSHSAGLSSPPELVDHDTDSSSEDESMPPSPPTNVLPSFPANQKHQEEISSKLYDQGFYVPPRNPTRLISAISVY